jgi:hypothetical protein
LTPCDTLDATMSNICVPGYSSKVCDVPTTVKDQVYQEYGITSRPGAGGKNFHVWLVDPHWHQFSDAADSRYRLPSAPSRNATDIYRSLRAGSVPIFW